MPVGAQDHTRGPEGAEVTLVEYGDFQCRYCGAACPIVKELVEAEPIRFVFRNFPITTLHPLAEIAAEAAEAAGVQGKYRQMHDWIYEHQDTLAPEDLREAAALVGLDLRRFTKDLTEHRYERKIRDDFMGGVRSGVTGTPTFFINGVRHDGGLDLETLLAVVQEAAAV